MQRIITLTTDFGYRDYYVGALKGKIYSNIIGCNLVDISHGIGKYNTEEAGFVIGAAYKQFPKGSIHIIAVDASITEYSKALCVKYDGHYFVTSDNGIISVVLGNNDFDEAIFINHDGIMKSNDIFVYCAYQLHEGRALKDIGVFTDTVYIPNRWANNLVVGESRISGKVIYEDSYGNLVTNITKDCFESVANEREYAIRFKDYRINRVSQYFADFKNADWASLRERAGELVAIFNDVDLLTIALFYSKPDSPGGTPRKLMNVNLNDTIVIDFNQEEQ